MDSDILPSDFLLSSLLFPQWKNLERWTSCDASVKCIFDLFDSGILNSQNTISFIRKHLMNMSGTKNEYRLQYCDRGVFVLILDQVVDDMSDSDLKWLFGNDPECANGVYLIDNTEVNGMYTVVLSNIINRVVDKLPLSEIDPYLLVRTGDRSIFAGIVERNEDHIDFLNTILSHKSIPNVSDVEDIIIDLIRSIENVGETRDDLVSCLAQIWSDEQYHNVSVEIRELLASMPDNLEYILTECATRYQIDHLLAWLATDYPPHANRLNNFQSFKMIMNISKKMTYASTRAKIPPYLSDNLQQYQGYNMEVYMNKHPELKAESEEDINAILEALASEPYLDAYRTK